MKEPTSYFVIKSTKKTITVTTYIVNDDKKTIINGYKLKVVKLNRTDSIKIRKFIIEHIDKETLYWCERGIYPTHKYDIILESKFASKQSIFCVASALRYNTIIKAFNIWNSNCIDEANIFISDVKTQEEYNNNLDRFINDRRIKY